MSKDYFEIAQASIHELDRINTRLYEIVEELRIYQPVENGRVTLDLYKCSSEGCIGCPHPRWRTWRYMVTKTGETRFVSKVIDDPWRRVKSSGPFKENAFYIRKIIAEARDLLKIKEEFRKSFSALGSTLKKIPKASE